MEYDDDDDGDDEVQVYLKMAIRVKTYSNIM
jgi:hypothetical protein